VPVVEPEHKRVEVGLNVLRRDTLADTDDRSLEQRPERLDAQDVHAPIHERLSTVDGRVGVSDSGSDPPPATPSAGHALTRLTPTRDLHGSRGI
jgi:hypothetical protein